jgi:putative aminopeptidase FrvX
MKKTPSVSQTIAHLAALKPLVDSHITVERIRHYVASISSVASPSTAASFLRGPILRELLLDSKALENDRLHLRLNYEKTGNSVILTGNRNVRKNLWYIAHLDTVSYLVRPKQQSRYPLVPFCHHMIQNGKRFAVAYRFIASNSRYEIVAHGCLESEDSRPFFRPESGDLNLKPGDRVVFSTSYKEDRLTGNFSAHIDNAGGVAALLAAAPVLAAAKVEALLAFPDEEEGPPGSGNQMIGRGSARILSILPIPELVVVSDVQQTSGDSLPNTPGRSGEGAKLGEGAVLSEFSSLTRGAVTPPHLYTLAVEFVAALQEIGIKVQISDNSYTSRSDDVSVMLRTPNVLLLGFPGFNRHFDLGEPTANIYDLVNLAKAIVFSAALRTPLQQMWKQFEASAG